MTVWISDDIILPRMTRDRDHRFTQTEINEAFSKIPSAGQCLIFLNNQTFLLSVSAPIDEKYVYKMWVQDPGPIQIDEDSNLVEPYNQLIYTSGANESGDTPIQLLEKHGYPNIKKGREIDFFCRLLLEGKLTLIQK